MAEAQNNESVDTSESTEPDTNPFRKRIQAHKRTLSSLRGGDVPTVRSRRRRTRSPSVSSRASEVNMTHFSSQELSYPDLSNVVTEEQAESSSTSEHDKSRFLDSTDASLLQIELDRRLAQRLQQEEEDENNVAELLWAQLMDAAHPLPLQQPGGSAGRDRSGPHAFIQTGSRDDPISLDSDSDSDSEDDEEVIFTGRNRPREDQVHSEDTILLDDDSSEWESCANFDDAQTAIDANLARMLQDEENLNQSTYRSTRECAVCGEQQPISELPSLADCEHVPQTCTECYADWVTAQLEESSWKEAKCPESKCQMTLTYHEIQGIATQDTFQKYDTYITRAAISEDPNFRWCRACDAGQEHLSGEDGNIFTCHACGHKICIKHENTWHEDETCEEYDYRSSGQKERDQKAQEEASLAAIGKLSKKCPGPKCVYNIEKNDGCDHMTCSKCRYEFCWVCLSEYNKIRRQGNSAHKRDCKYYM
ncbi:hypothetical protein FB567DRAFT_454260 [Paraphoma chrysanthemicola]|uniref:RBR-type E3 ubiquitin transferase n=1 Tax=Paraphoma chrysanthemicola TaxID=798071 RepID=A0A8K0QVV3_9PLEO|nr:hypothetical protein FB567DRAFT_454260 [Paraphoma chrysanthemicola]